MTFLYYIFVDNPVWKATTINKCCIYFFWDVCSSFRLPQRFDYKHNKFLKLSHNWVWCYLWYILFLLWNELPLQMCICNVVVLNVFKIACLFLKLHNTRRFIMSKKVSNNPRNRDFYNFLVFVAKFPLSTTQYSPSHNLIYELYLRFRAFFGSTSCRTSSAAVSRCITQWGNIALAPYMASQTAQKIAICTTHIMWTKTKKNIGTTPSFNTKYLQTYITSS